MVDETRITKGPKGADYFQNAAFPDKTAVTGHSIAVFEDGGDPHANWPAHMPEQYSTAMDIELQIFWFSVNVTTGNVRWRAEVERLAVGGNPLTADNFGTLKEVTSNVQGTLAVLSKAVIPITRADMGTINPGDPFRLRLTRRTTDAADTLVGNALMYFWTMKQ